MQEGKEPADNNNAGELDGKMKYTNVGTIEVRSDGVWIDGQRQEKGKTISHVNVVGGISVGGMVVRGPTKIENVNVGHNGNTKTSTSSNSVQNHYDKPVQHGQGMFKPKKATLTETQPLVQSVQSAPAEEACACRIL